MLPQVALPVRSAILSPTQKSALSSAVFKSMFPDRWRDGLMKINIFWLNKAAVEQGSRRLKVKRKAVLPRSWPSTHVALRARGLSIELSSG